MSSEELGLVPPQNSNLTSQPHLFPEESSLRFARGDSCPKTRDLGSTSGFIGDRFFSSQGPEFRRSLYPSNGPDLRDPPPPAPPNWNGSDTQSGDATDGNDDDDEDEDDDVDEVPVGEVSVKDGASVQASARSSSSEIQRQGHMGNYHNAVTIAEADGKLYYAYLRGTTSGQKDVVESQCGFSGRKEAAFHSESGDSLRSILSDPITGDLMDDAMVLPCGHSFGSGGIQQVIGMKACSTCSHPISEDSILPNLSLRTAVQAFRCEEELLLQRSSKRRRERFELDKDKDSMYGADCLLDPSRGSRGVQFPFAVMDRVIIKGNKRTPPRFVGREAIVTTQCLNGWYVVKTVDNAESVKLQYRSLAKLTHDSSKPLPVSNSTSTSKMAPPWQL